MFVFDETTILHADADAFYASVEQRDDPALRGRPVLVGGGVVLAASYEARACGVRGGMGGREARRRCPDAVVLTPRWRAYTEASDMLFRVFREFSPVVEALGLEEAFLDVRGLERMLGSPQEIAIRLRAEARRRAGLAVSVGVARTKVLAKMASAAAKPDDLRFVPVGGEREFLDPLPVEALWGVGPATAARLRAAGIFLVGALAATPERRLVALLGPGGGRRAHALAHGRDNSRVRPGRGRRSVGAQSALGRATRDQARIDRVLLGLADRVTRRMRAAGHAGRTVSLRLRFGDYTRASLSRSLPRPTSGTGLVLATARGLLVSAWPRVEARSLTLVGIAVTNLESGPQLVLPPDGPGSDAVDAAVDRVRERFGAAAVTRATLLSTGRGSDTPPAGTAMIAP